jgi:hypothetical protein
MIRRMLGLILSTVLAYAAFGCSPCNHTGMLIFTDVAQTAASPGSAPQTLVEVRGTGFTPRTMVTILFQNLPTSSREEHKFADTSAVSDAEGHFTWTKDISAFPALDHSFDPNADVMVTAKEVYVSCTATTMIKAAAMLNPPAK